MQRCRTPDAVPQGRARQVTRLRVQVPRSESGDGEGDVPCVTALSWGAIGQCGTQAAPGERLSRGRSNGSGVRNAWNAERARGEGTTLAAARRVPAPNGRSLSVRLGGVGALIALTTVSYAAHTCGRGRRPREDGNTHVGVGMSDTLGGLARIQRTEPPMVRLPAFRTSGRVDARRVVSAVSARGRRGAS